MFLNRQPDAVPHALLHNLAHNQIIHERVVFVTIAIKDIPWVPAGVNRAITVKSDPGTILHVAWPGGVSKATTSATYSSVP